MSESSTPNEEQSPREAKLQQITFLLGSAADNVADAAADD